MSVSRMKKHLPLVVASTALLVSVLGATPVGGAAVEAVGQIPPLAQRANFAKTAGTANNAKALGGQKPSAYARLGSNGKLAVSLLPKAATGPQGPKGDKGEQGEKGEKGDKGPQGPGGLVNAFKSALPKDGVYRPADGSTAATLSLPLGRYVIFGRVLVSQANSSPRGTFYAHCFLSAGGDSDYAQVRGVFGKGLVTPASMMVIHEFTTAGSATLKCNTGNTEPATWANARIVAVQVRSQSIVAGGGTVKP